MNRIFQSLIQSSFGGKNKNFEAVVLENHDLWHWWRDNSGTTPTWRRSRRIVSNLAAYPGAIIQSSFGVGNFEVVVPLFSGFGNIELWHYWRDNSNASKYWECALQITRPDETVVGAASIIQSSFKTGEHGNLEVIVPVRDKSGRTSLLHFWHDSANRESSWKFGRQVNPPEHEVLGPACLIQGSMGTSGMTNFEVCAFVRLEDGREVLQHYWRDHSEPNFPWRTGSIISEHAAGSGVIIQSDYGATHSNFEIVVPIKARGNRTYLQHYWRDNSSVELAWQAGSVISEVVAKSGVGCIIQSDYGTEAGNGNLELLVDECEQALSGYWRSNNIAYPWYRNAFLISDHPWREAQRTERICQLTGVEDRTDWKDTSFPPNLAFNAAAMHSAHIRGTDLGSSFEHDGKIFFLFGDTWRNIAPQKDGDAIAYTSDRKIESGVKLQVNPTPPLLNGVSQGKFEVPLDGFSYRGSMYVFFSSEYLDLKSNPHMGCSILGVSNDLGSNFSPLLTFSRSKFINVSVLCTNLAPSQSEAVGWKPNTKVLWVWASGRYRSSPAYLAIVNLNPLLALIAKLKSNNATHIQDLPRRELLVRYFTGDDNVVTWSPDEEDATPLFPAGDLGELSCRYNHAFRRYFITYNSASPRGIVLRHAKHPWGPWSGPVVIFNPTWGQTSQQSIGTGYGRFMHIPGGNPPLDYVQDNLRDDGQYRNDEYGGEYGPYQISQLSKGILDKSCELVYVMSTWNPYQVVLMRTQLAAHELGV